MKKILIIEDDVSIAEIERDFLQMEGFEVTIVADGLVGCKRAREEEYDLILLDLMLPGMNGYDICRNIRGEVDVPIIMVTAKDDDTDKIRGLGLGADDYISKLASPSELVARVKANLAQYERLKSGSKSASDRTGELNAGPITVNTSTRCVYLNGVELELKNKEYEMLKFLASNPGIVFSKEQLYEQVWGIEAIGDMKTVVVHINKLREKIEKDLQNPVYLQTVWGVGYRFRV